MTDGIVQSCMAKLEAQTVRRYMRVANGFAAWSGFEDAESSIRNLAAMGRADGLDTVRRWVASLIDSGLSASTATAATSVVASLVKSARDAGLCEWAVEDCSPKRQQNNHRPVPMRSDVETLLRHLDTMAYDLDRKAARDAAIVRLLYSGMSRTEVVRLLVSDAVLDGDEACVMTVRRVDGSKRRISIPIAPATVVSIRHWLDLRLAESPSAPLFHAFHAQSVNGAKSAMSGEGVRFMLRHRSIQAGIDPVRPHGLKHGCSVHASDSMRPPDLPIVVGQQEPKASDPEPVASAPEPVAFDPPERTDAAAVELCEANDRLVHWVVRKLGNVISNGARVEYEDVLQWGRMGLWHAAQRFDASMGLQFSGYACQCIRGYILTNANKYRTGGHPGAENAFDYTKVFRYVGDNEKVMMHERIDSDSTVEAVNSAEIVEVMRAAVDQLNGRRREIGHMILDGMRDVEIAERINVSRARVGQVREVVKNHLRRSIRRDHPSLAGAA